LNFHKSIYHQQGKTILTLIKSTTQFITRRKDMAVVHLYEHSNFRGRRLDIEAGGVKFVPIDRTQFGVSSLQVPPGFTVVLSNSQGSTLLYKENTDYSYVGDEMNDRVEGVEVTQICAPDAEVC
jgi:hypothetical protein